MSARGVAAYLGVTDRTVSTIAAREGWPRKRVLGKVVFPRALVAAFLEGCPDGGRPKALNGKHKAAS